MNEQREMTIAEEIGAAEKPSLFDDPYGSVQPMQPEPTALEKLLDWLTRPPGEGTADDYRDHVLNWAPWSEGVAKFLWGLTGLLGESLNLAIVAVVTGLIQYYQELSERGSGD